MPANGRGISVVVPTRNRGSAVATAISTILANDHPDFEVIVVDQSDDDRTRASLEPFLEDRRVRYLRSAGRGRSAGLNEAILEARGELVLTTDDDCTVPPDWLHAFETAFAVSGRIGIVFGNVVAAPHDEAAGCIPTYVRPDSVLARSLRDKHRVEGIGACMALRREVWRALGGFDEMLGVGAPFQAGEDGDLAVRALFAGHWVYETPGVQVTHCGVRNWEQVPALIEGYWFGTGAMLAKSIRIRPGWIAGLMVRFAVRWALGSAPIRSNLGGRRDRRRKLSAFCRGWLAGARCAVDRRTGLFAPPAPGRTPVAAE